MTREELALLSSDQLLALALQDQDRIVQLSERVARLEAQLTEHAEPAAFLPIPPASLIPPLEVETQLPVDPSLVTVEHKRHHRRRHRAWHERFLRWLFPGNLQLRKYLFIVFIVLLLSVLLGLFVAQNLNQSAPVPAGFLISHIVG
ncbi:MAG: hypothetical protein HY327_09070 [Chloroflexi bacterium]|nr:hypothetical protein [Chloroflexota bacterium]